MNRALSLLVGLVLAACDSTAATTPDGGPACVHFGDLGDCQYPPTRVATRTRCGAVPDFCEPTTRTTPSLSCLGQPAALPSGAAKVMLTGRVQPMSSGPDTRGITVQIFTQSALTAGGDPATLTPIAASVVSLGACDVDPAKGCSLVSTTGCATPSTICNDGLNGRPDDNKYCRDLGAGSSECSNRARWENRYVLPGVPTDVALAMRATGAGGKPDTLWATTIAFGVVLSTSDPACDSSRDAYCFDTRVPAAPKYQLDLHPISQSDYLALPVAAGLGGGISSVQGAVIGEIRDCDNIRVSNVQVRVPTVSRLAYFGDDPTRILPDVTRAGVGTGQLGLYGAFDVSPGPQFIDTQGLPAAGAQPTSFGDMNVIVYANAITIANINGGRRLPK